MWYRHEEEFWNCDQNFTFANQQTAYGKEKKLEWMYSNIYVYGASNLLSDTHTQRICFLVLMGETNYHNDFHSLTSLQLSYLSRSMSNPRPLHDCTLWQVFQSNFSKGYSEIS